MNVYKARKRTFYSCDGRRTEKTGDMSRSYSVLAAYLESKNLPYRLERYRTSRIDPDTGRKKTYNGVLNRI